MPRRKNQFSDLERMAKAAGLQAAEGSVLGNYLAFKAGKRKRESRKTTKLTAAQRKRLGISLLPFNKTVPGTIAAADRYRATITQFSAAARTNLNTLSDADLGYAGVTGTNTSSDYYPALVKPSVRLSDTPTTPKSGITGVEYKYYQTNNYSIPFGRRTASAATDTEEDRRMALTTQMKNAATPPASVGYDPEVFRHDPRATVDELDGVPAPPAPPAPGG